jgi:penicillin-binding protein 2
MALAALETGKRTPAPPSTTPARSLRRPHLPQPRDHALGAVDMHRSHRQSSNVYYYSLANEMGVDLPSTTS